ncbi:MAG: MotA/TolQ/ExbB proton channel family protein [Limnobacter sp.]|uniref:MotA/TolQ/ExbB proton channel family protein n=1 Tax=Limnobacter sp. TaxID=2003368 RepID=UPI00391C3A86
MKSALSILKGIAALMLVVGMGSGQAIAQDKAQPATAPAAQAAQDVPQAPPMPPSVKKEEVENPYGLSAIWAQGDFVAKGTLIIMIIMSMGSWYVIVTKLLEQRKLFSQATQARNSFWSAGNVNDGLKKLDESSAFHFVADNAINASNEHTGQLAQEISKNVWIELAFNRAFEEIQSRLQIGMSFLATVGSTAPFIGLFGTVWGIYHALTAIGIAGQASIDKVAGPVGEALIMTAIGLAVAVPAVLGYNWLIRRNKAAIAQVHAFSADLEKVLLGGAKPKAQ